VYSSSLGINLLNNQQVAIKFEPRKSDAPQLRDEYRTYKILAGSSKCGRLVAMLIGDWDHAGYMRQRDDGEGTLPTTRICMDDG